MINFNAKYCKSSFCNTTTNNKSKGYCFFCFVHVFPDEPLSRNYKTKEKYISNYILQVFKDNEYTW